DASVQDANSAIAQSPPWGSSGAGCQFRNRAIPPPQGMQQRRMPIPQHDCTTTRSQGRIAPVFLKNEIIHKTFANVTQSVIMKEVGFALPKRKKSL
ncbi:MAG: hypothetical protein RR865_00005, partial [Clostridia bacterium]